MEKSTLSKTYVSYTKHLSNDRLELFWKKVDKSGDCWTWIASKSKDGYGYFWIGYKNVTAHIVSYIIHNKSYDPDLLVCHTCDNPSCVNPDHLFQASHIENMNDMVQKNRTPHGKLTIEQVQTIKCELQTHSGKELAEKYGVSKSAISRIKLNKSYGKGATK